MRSIGIRTAAAALILMGIAEVPAPAQHRLPAGPQNVVWGYYDSTTPPVLRVRSGESVEMHTLIVSSPDRLEEAGVPFDAIEPALREIHSTLESEGPHILTGPVYIEEAEPGDVLEVRIRSVELAIPYASNTFMSRGGLLPEDFPYSRFRIVPLDEENGVARFGEGVEIPLRPFFGSMGVGRAAA